MTSSARSRQVANFGIGFLLLLVSLAGLMLNGRWLLAQGYARYTVEHLQDGSNGADGRVAAEWAVRLTPYAVRPYLLSAAVLERAGQQSAALEQSRRALRYGAADPFVWLTHARLKMRVGQMDDELTLALSRVEQLAPRSYWLQSRMATLGLQYWEWGRPDQRASWTRSIDFVLATDAQTFLRTVLSMRRETLFCREFRTRATVLEPWCQGALAARQLCYTTPRRPGIQAWCRRVGLSMDLPHD
jgi:hypothetical protein